MRSTRRHGLLGHQPEHGERHERAGEHEDRDLPPRPRDREHPEGEADPDHRPPGRPHGFSGSEPTKPGVLVPTVPTGRGGVSTSGTYTTPGVNHYFANAATTTTPTAA